MFLLDFLQAVPKVTAVVGSGGKTSLLAQLAETLSGTVCLTTTTHIMPFGQWPTATNEDELGEALSRSRVVCVGTPDTAGKLSSPWLSIERLAEPFDYVIVEADGSRQRPLKAHAAWEPQVPAEAGLVVLVVGATGLGMRVADAAHRPELLCERAGCLPDDVATPRLVARAIRRECELGIVSPDRIVVSCARGTRGGLLVRELASLLPDVPVAAFDLSGREATGGCGVRR